MAHSESVQLIGIALPTLRELRAATLASLSSHGSGEADAVDSLREAGYAGGDAVFGAFERWLAENPSAGGAYRLLAPELSLDDFTRLASRFFRDAGWGDVEFSPDEDQGVAQLVVRRCWECDGADPSDRPSCHITTGMFAAFFGRVADYPVSVMETECCSAGAAQCRFLLGNAEVMTWKWETL